MKSFSLAKFSFLTISILGALCLSFAFGLYSGSEQTIIYHTVRALKNNIEKSFTSVTDEFTTLTKTRPKHFLQPARQEGSGVTINHTSADQQELIFMTGFFNDTNELRLIKRDGTIVARWQVRFSDIFPDPDHMIKPPQTDWNIDIHGALALPDGSVVFNFEYGGLVKLDRFGNTVWMLPMATHHSVERAQDGGFWVPGRRYLPEKSKSPFPPFTTPYEENIIMKISEQGEVITEISVPKLFYDNELEALLTSTTPFVSVADNNKEWREIVHLNKIAELSSDIAHNFVQFKAGDLALSFRDRNLVIIIDPDSGTIKWWRIGPWLRQHDPEFSADGTIVVFNNNTYTNKERKAFGYKGDNSLLTVPRRSNILAIDPLTDEYRVVYGGQQSEAMLSVIRGKVKLTENDGLLVTEFEGGRVFETDASGKVIWEYINRYNSDKVAEITEARMYPASYFTVEDWINQ